MISNFSSRTKKEIVVIFEQFRLSVEV